MRNSFPDVDVYTLANRCPTCCEAPQQPCVMRRGGRDTHLARQDAGVRQYYRDVRNAPWPEERDPRRCYCSIAGCKR